MGHRTIEAESKLIEKREIIIAGKYDVIIAGAGVAGVAAALAATRRRQKVLLIEKSAMPGWLATLGLIAVYLPLCDGKGRKLIGGISEELLLDSIKYGYSNLADEWKQNTDEIKLTEKKDIGLNIPRRNLFSQWKRN